MSRRGKKAAQGAPETRAARPTVTVCRGCCCGTAAKVPRLDHEAQLTDLRTSLAGVAMVRRADCLDACERANVIVVQPSAEGRKAGGRPVWLGQVNDPGAAADITAWVNDGGPGLVDPPDVLDLYTFTPSRRVRHELED
ncbi:(2Fe-2S) ferredoxin domain-containing protein [Streptomyces microflavus]|uniref:(2Fe-2S) ferredoxin domain-containing protein n=1 Tax=Streptomyces microflavus TaxID=1919 RepID=UPI0033E64D0A